MIARGTFVDRGRPDLRGLAAIEDPEEFVWAILPHAARSFAASIVMLPADKALPAAVAYLYCRMLDTYEDLTEDQDAKREALDRFADRFADHTPRPAPDLTGAQLVDQRDRTHVLLVERCGLVDEVFAALTATDRANIAELVSAMGQGMAEAAAAFERQGGVLESEEQLLDYCHTVIGEPALFSMRLLTNPPITADRRRDALEVSEMIQLANVTRDIEKDLRRGVGYHPALRPYLHRATETDAATTEQVRLVREELMALALSRASAYRRLVDDLGTPRLSATRASALLMLLFTDRHYRSCAVATGHEAWDGPVRTSMIIAQAALAGLSSWWAERRTRAVERNFLAAAERIGSGARRG
jgi:phytoene/squalene synthetase